MHEQIRYPHLLPQDAAVLTAFLIEHGHRYTAVDFDVRVGEGRDPGPDFPDQIRQMALDLSRRRIDALGHAHDHHDIIEVTGAAGTTALGQLITYKNLHISGKIHTYPPHIIIAARNIQNDMLPAFKALGIEICLYPNAPE